MAAEVAAGEAKVAFALATAKAVAAAAALAVRLHPGLAAAPVAGRRRIRDGLRLRRRCKSRGLIQRDWLRLIRRQHRCVTAAHFQGRLVASR